MPELDLSNDWRFIHDPVRVRYAVKTAEGAWAEAVDVDYGQRQEVNKQDVTAYPELLAERATVFHLWRALLGEITPKIGDKLAHDGDVWVVQSVRECDRDGRGVQRFRLIVTQSTGSQELP